LTAAYVDITIEQTNQYNYNTSKHIQSMVETTLPVSHDTHEIVRSKKRGGETFDTLIRRVFEEYEPGV